MKKTLKRGLSLLLALIICLGVLPFRPLVTKTYAQDAGVVVANLATNAAKSFVGSAASTVGGIVAGNILSAFGYEDPETKFRKEVTQSLEDIKKSISDGVQQLSGQLNQIQSDLTTLQNYCANMKNELFAKIDHSEVDTRLTVINNNFATVETIYEDYLDLAKLSDYKEAESTAKHIIDEIADAKLDSAITRLNNEFTGTSGGAQTPLIVVYATYLMEAYPFMHQVYERLMNFAQYCEYELLMTSQLYIEYCNYMQALNDGDDGEVKYWQREAEKAIENLNNGLEKIELLLPTTDYSLIVDGKYHLFSQKYNVDIWFDPDYDFPVDVKGTKELYYPSENLPTVAEYKRLGQIFSENGSDNKKLPECINELAGTDIETPLWDCICEVPLMFWFSFPGPAVIDLDDYSQSDEWKWKEREGTDRVWARHGDTPAYHPGVSNLLGQAHGLTATTVTLPTCTNPGEAKYTCSDGGAYTEVIPALAHTDNDDNGLCDSCDALMTGDDRCTVCGEADHDNFLNEALHTVIDFAKSFIADIQVLLKTIFG